MGAQQKSVIERVRGCVCGKESVRVWERVLRGSEKMQVERQTLLSYLTDTSRTQDVLLLIYSLSLSLSTSLSLHVTLTLGLSLSYFRHRYHLCSFPILNSTAKDVQLTLFFLSLTSLFLTFLSFFLFMSTSVSLLYFSFHLSFSPMLILISFHPCLIYLSHSLSYFYHIF